MAASLLPTVDSMEHSLPYLIGIGLPPPFVLTLPTLGVWYRSASILYKLMILCICIPTECFGRQAVGKREELFIILIGWILSGLDMLEFVI